MQNKTKKNLKTTFFIVSLNIRVQRGAARICLEHVFTFFIVDFIAFLNESYIPYILQ